MSNRINRSNQDALGLQISSDAAVTIVSRHVESQHRHLGLELLNPALQLRRPLFGTAIAQFRRHDDADANRIARCPVDGFEKGGFRGPSLRHPFYNGFSMKTLSGSGL
jgi:hypothetical protein